MKREKEVVSRSLRGRDSGQGNGNGTQIKLGLRRDEWVGGWVDQNIVVREESVGEGEEEDRMMKKKRKYKTNEQVFI